MGIRITNAPDEYEYVHMGELLITQAPLKHKDDSPKYTVSFAFRRYKVDVDGNLEHLGTSEHHYVDDYYAQAIAEFMAGSSILAQALEGNQNAVAKLIHDNTVYNTEVI